MALEPCGNLVVADKGNRRVVRVHGVLPGCRTWLALVIHSGGAE